MGNARRECGAAEPPGPLRPGRATLMARAPRSSPAPVLLTTRRRTQTSPERLGAQGAREASTPRVPPGRFIALGGGGRAVATVRSERHGAGGRRGGRRASTCITRPDSLTPALREGPFGQRLTSSATRSLVEPPRRVASTGPKLSSGDELREQALA